MKREIFDKKTISPTVIQPIDLGGSETNTPGSACQFLHLVSENDIGVSHGVVPLDANSKVPVQYLPGLTTVNGDTIQIMDTVIYEGRYVEGVARITNYDCKRTYDISTDWDGEGGAQATLVLQSDIDQGIVRGVEPGRIDFQAPYNSRIVLITVNHNTFPVTVLPGYIEKPMFVPHGEITSIVDGITSNYADILAVGSEPDWSPHGYAQSTIMMQLEVASDINFTTIIYTNTVNTNDVGNNISVSGLTSREYYARFKYIGNTIESPWSDTAHFTIYFNTYPTTEHSIIYGQGVEPDHAFQFGFHVDLSADGLILAVGSDQIYGLPGQTANMTGVVHILKRSTVNSVFQVQKTLIAPNDSFLGYYNYGAPVKVADNGNLVFVLCPTAVQFTNVFDKSKLFVYKTTVRDDPSTLTLLTSIVIPHVDYSSYTGNSAQLAVTPDGRTIAIVQNTQHSPPTGVQVHNVSYIKLFDFQNDTLTFVTDIASYNDNDWGYAVIDIDDSGTRLVIGAASADANNQNEWRGAAYIYDRIAGIWTQTGVLNPPVGANEFGISIAISGDGNTLAVGDYSPTRLTYNDTVDGVVYTYEFANQMWGFNGVVSEPQPSSSNNQYSPWDIKLSYNGNLMFIGSASSEIATLASGLSGGVVTIFEKASSNSNEWVLAYELVGGVLNFNSERYMGERIAISSDGTSLVASARNDDNSFGSVHIFQ